MHSFRLLPFSLCVWLLACNPVGAQGTWATLSKNLDGQWIRHSISDDRVGRHFIHCEPILRSISGRKFEDAPEFRGLYDLHIDSEMRHFGVKTGYTESVDYRNSKYNILYFSYGSEFIRYVRVQAPFVIGESIASPADHYSGTWKIHFKNLARVETKAIASIKDRTVVWHFAKSDWTTGKDEYLGYIQTNRDGKTDTLVLYSPNGGLLTFTLSRDDISAQSLQISNGDNVFASVDRLPDTSEATASQRSGAHPDRLQFTNFEIAMFTGFAILVVLYAIVTSVWRIGGSGGTASSFEPLIPTPRTPQRDEGYPKQERKEGY